MLKPITPDVKLTDADKGLLGKITDLNLSEITESLLKNAEFATFDDNLAMFSGPCWKILSPRQARRVVRRMLQAYPGKLNSYISGRSLKELIERIEDSAPNYATEDIPHPDPHLLCCLDGMYRWPDGTIHRPSSKDLRLSHLEVSAANIRPSPTPYFTNFMEMISQGDQSIITRLLEVLGVIISGYPAKNFFVFEGVHDSGKSQLAEFLKIVLGRTSCFAINGPNQLQGRWTTGMLPGKLLCICGDIPAKPINLGSISIIKQMSGGDQVSGEQKFKDLNTFKNTAKLLFLSNFPLKFAGPREDHAIQRRHLSVPFRYSIPEREQIPEFHQRLVDEAGGIIWQALQALDAWEKNGCIYTEVQGDLSNPLPSLPPTHEERVRHFVDQECELVPEAVTTVAALYERFQEFEACNLIASPEPMNAKVFGRVLNALDLPIHQDDTAKKRRRRGIRLASRISYE